LGAVAIALAGAPQPVVAERQEVVLGPRRPIVAERLLDAGAERPPPLHAAAARAGKPKSAVGGRVRVGIRPGKTGLAVKQRGSGGAERCSKASRQGSERIDAGAAVRTEVEAREGQTGVGACHAGGRGIGFKTQDESVPLPVVAALNAAESSGRAHRVAVNGGAEGVLDVEEVQAAAELHAGVEAAPVDFARDRCGSGNARGPPPARATEYRQSPIFPAASRLP